LSTLVLKIALKPAEHVQYAMLNGISMVSYYEEAGYGFIELAQLDAKKYELIYRLGANLPKTFINHTDSYLIYSTTEKAGEFSFRARIYGKQTIEISGLDKPLEIISENDAIELVDITFDQAAKKLYVKLKGLDIQGETGIIRVLTK